MAENRKFVPPASRIITVWVLEFSCISRESLHHEKLGATAGLSSSVERRGGSALLDEPAVAPRGTILGQATGRPIFPRNQRRAIFRRCPQAGFGFGPIFKTSSPPAASSAWLNQDRANGLPLRLAD